MEYYKNILQVPEGRVENLHVNFFLNNLMAEVALHKDAQTGDPGIACDKCISGDPALMICATCSHFLCNICSQAHQRDKLTCSHKLITLEELNACGAAALSKPAVCSVHEGETLKLFCETCQVTICRDCTMIKHK